jgi:carbamoyl-phosphate synthase large subunit
MKSTGEAMGISSTFGDSFARATIAAGSAFPKSGKIFISVNDNDKLSVIPIARDFREMGFDIIATDGTSKALRRNGIQAEMVYKVGEGRPNVVDGIKNGEIKMVIDTPLGQQSRYDEEAIGKAAIKKGIPLITTLSGASAAVRALRTGSNSMEVRTLQEYYDEDLIKI